MLSDTEFRELLHHLDRPWAGYRRVRKRVKKRVRRHMATMGGSTIDAYLLALDRLSGAREACEQCLQVTISRFFRDRELWQTLRERILPELVEQFPAPIRIWSAGCACGEEPYSLAMLWEELGRPTQLDLLATDANSACLAHARAGVYSLSSLKRMPEKIRERYFHTKI
jgi:chemotaxis protein methyltransferase CheR